jgi:hypothetical protein
MRFPCEILAFLACFHAFYIINIGLNRKTIYFLKNEQIHDNVIGKYIQQYYYKTGTYGYN